MTNLHHPLVDHRDSKVSWIRALIHLPKGLNSTKTFKAQLNFNLVELLVVISIFATLSSLLMPSLKKGLRSARALSCTSQMKSLSLAIGLFQLDNNDLFPYNTKFPGSSDSIDWTDRLSPYDGRDLTETQINRFILDDPELAELNQQYFCPLNESIDPFENNRSRLSYKMTSLVLDSNFEPSGYHLGITTVPFPNPGTYIPPEGYFGLRVSDLNFPQRTIVNVDHTKEENSASMAGALGNPYNAHTVLAQVTEMISSPDATVAKRMSHGQGDGFSTNYSFADGHVSAHSMEETLNDDHHLSDNSGSWWDTTR
jgi:prepilin-type processing-associated H-X9-DG protein